MTHQGRTQRSPPDADSTVGIYRRLLSRKCTDKDTNMAQNVANALAAENLST